MEYTQRNEKKNQQISEISCIADILRLGGSVGGMCGGWVGGWGRVSLSGAYIDPP